MTSTTTPPTTIDPDVDEHDGIDVDHVDDESD
jgi:hypothetical protein